MIDKEGDIYSYCSCGIFIDDDRSEDNDVVHQLSVFLDERDHRRWGSCVFISYQKVNKNDADVISMDIGGWGGLRSQSYSIYACNSTNHAHYLIASVTFCSS